MPSLTTIAKTTLPWVRRAAAVYDGYLLMQKRQALQAELASLPIGKARAKLLRQLADLEIELEKVAGKLK